MHPVLFNIPGLDWEVQAYGFFIGLSLLFGWVISLRLARADKLPDALLGTAYVLSAAVGILLARAAYLIQHQDRFEDWRSLFQLAPDGLAPFAGIVAGLLVSFIYVGRKRIPVLPWFDVVAPAYAVGAALERVGSFLAGSGFGRFVEPDFPLAIRFPRDSPAFDYHRLNMEMLLQPQATESLTVHPAQLYGFALALAGLGLCILIRRRRTFSGQVFIAFAMFHILTRTLVEEPYRADAEPGVLGPIGPGQLVGLVVVAVLAAVYRVYSAKAKTDPETMRQWLGGKWTPKEDRDPADAPSKSKKKPKKKKK